MQPKLGEPLDVFERRYWSAAVVGTAAVEPADPDNRLVDQCTGGGVCSLYESTGTHQPKLIRIEQNCSRHFSNGSGGLCAWTFEMVSLFEREHGVKPHLNSIPGLTVSHAVLSELVRLQISRKSLIGGCGACTDLEVQPPSHKSCSTAAAERPTESRRDGLEIGIATMWMQRSRTSRLS